jgi:hypothetical protein
MLHFIHKIILKKGIHELILFGSSIENAKNKFKLLLMILALSSHSYQKWYHKLTNCLSFILWFILTI